MSNSIHLEVGRSVPTAKRVLSRLATAAAVLLFLSPVSGQQPGPDPGHAGPDSLSPDVVARIGALIAERGERTPTQKKVSSTLLQAHAAADRVGQDPDYLRTTSSVKLDSEGLVRVDIRADATPDVVSRIEELGGFVVSSSSRYRTVRAHLPLETVVTLAELDTIEWIRPAEEPVSRRQTSRLRPVVDDPVVPPKVNTSEGDIAHRANQARREYGVDGTGIGVGVLSNGVKTLATRQSSGDVPHVTVLAGQQGPSTHDEGTAMLEIVHDLAPGADLYFATAAGGRHQFAENIEALCDAGADIIVDDTGYVEDSVFHDGIVARGVNAAVADGCIYFSAAGNDGHLDASTSGVWEGDFVPGEYLPFGDRAGFSHTHGGPSGTTLNRITSYGFDAVCLKWSDLDSASSSDYDLYLIHPTFIVESTNNQDIVQEPVECIYTVVNDSDSGIDLTGSQLLIVHVDGPDRYLHLSTHGGQLLFATSGAMYGHPATRNAIAVAATDVTQAGGVGGIFNGTESIEVFSSDGPRRVFFDSDDQAVTPANFSSTGGYVLKKPDVTAANRVSTATSPFETFRGTSAAAPHAAAIAALMLHAAGGPGSLTRETLLRAMQETASDIGGRGWDRNSGWGVIDALAAVALVAE